MNKLTETLLKESTYFILLSLSLEPKHGYTIMKDVRALSENRVVFSTGTLYGALKRLLDQGWIIRLDDFNPKDHICDRKVYMLSERGRSILKEEITRLQRFLVTAKHPISEEHT